MFFLDPLVWEICFVRMTSSVFCLLLGLLRKFSSNVCSLNNKLLGSGPVARDARAFFLCIYVEAAVYWPDFPWSKPETPDVVCLGLVYFLAVGVRIACDLSPALLLAALGDAFGSVAYRD